MRIYIHKCHSKVIQTKTLQLQLLVNDGVGTDRDVQVVRILLGSTRRENVGNVVFDDETKI